MCNLFFIADPHFNHSSIIKYESRPFQTVEEMDEILIKNWNDVVHKKEKIFILGDFAWGNKDQVKAYIKRLNGIKSLLLGNHDRNHSITWWSDMGFWEITQYPIIFEEWFILSHEPVQLNKSHIAPYYNIYGHMHGREDYAWDRRGLCVSVERINYKPIELGEIKKLIGVSNDCKTNDCK